MNKYIQNIHNEGAAPFAAKAPALANYATLPVKALNLVADLAV